LLAQLHQFPIGKPQRAVTIFMRGTVQQRSYAKQALKLDVRFKWRNRGWYRMRCAAGKALAAAIAKLCAVFGLLPALRTRGHLLNAASGFPSSAGTLPHNSDGNARPVGLRSQSPSFLCSTSFRLCPACFLARRNGERIIGLPAPKLKFSATNYQFVAIFQFV
jgi:hypothetical protein